MESALRVQWGKWRRVRHRFLFEKCRVAVVILVGVPKTRQNREVIERHPKQVGVKNVLLDFGSSGQIEVRMIAVTKRRHWLTKCLIPMRPEDARTREIVRYGRVRISRSEPEIIS